MTEMNNEKILSEVIGIIGKHTRNQGALATASMETELLKDLQINSARFVDIILEFEDRFNVQIPDEEADSISTVGDAVTLVGKLLH